MLVEERDIDSIRPYENNPRENDSGVDAVAASIREFGVRQPVVVDEDGVVIVGHTRLKAAKKLGLKTIAVHVATGLSPAQAKAYRIADNQTANLSSWDFDKLPLELLGLQNEGFDLNLTGFSADELMKLLDDGPKDGLTDPDEIPEPPDEATTQPGDLWLLGNHRLLCGDSSKVEDVDRLLDGAIIHMVNTDPPYNVNVEPASQGADTGGQRPGKRPRREVPSWRSLEGQRARGIKPPRKTPAPPPKTAAKGRRLMGDFVSDEEFAQRLLAWFGNIARVLKSGRCFYLWGGYANIANYPPALDANDLYMSQCIIWVKGHPVISRKDYMGDHEWCQPSDTKVETPDGPVPISSLRDNDRVISYSRNHHAMIGLRRGESVQTTSRHYQGNLFGVNVANQTTWATPGHLWSVKLSPIARDWWCVYLMRRGQWWRVGKSKLLSTYGFGVKHRLKTEGGDAVWILSVHPSNLEATIDEQLVLAQYGIPTTTWSESAAGRRTIADIRALYERLDLPCLHQNALRLLADYGRHVDCPFMVPNETRTKVGRRTSSLARTCNLFPTIMMVPIPGKGQKVTWEPIRAIDRQPFDGPVYSMNVGGFRHYVADGIVTHNCFYGWRKGAGHDYFGPNNATDVWSVKKVNPQSMIHLTEKPVELARRAMEYSSKLGENVLDLFGGSGSTLIACEQTKRKAFLMEIDPLYCDVIVDRFQKFTGQTAQRIEGNQ